MAKTTKKKTNKSSTANGPKKKKATPTKKGREAKELANFKLGESHTDYPEAYAPHVLEAFPNKNPSKEAWTSLLCTDFTSLCPKTNQPDFARITINYIADKEMVESKSFKLYLFSYRNHGDFHEDCVQKICDDLVALMKPKYIEVIGEFTPRGGIAIYPFACASSKETRFQNLLKKRQENYAPGLYTMPFSRIY
jgi:7-cyano-7-deazaguanine reductase